jgi:GT2 family glycosyltransferase
MINHRAFISIIIPVYNGEKYLAEAIDSVLSQTYPTVEVIVIDDGSQDASAEIARSYGSQILYYYQDNAGLGDALNTGVAHASGEFLSFLDQDDLWVSHKLTRQMQEFTNNNQVDAVFGYIEQFHSAELTPSTQQRYHVKQQIMSGYCADTLLISRKAFLRVGTFDSSLRTTTFLDWYARAKEYGLQMIMVKEVLAKRRIHTTNISITHKSTVNKEYLQLLKSALDRRRSTVKPEP